MLMEYSSRLPEGGALWSYSPWSLGGPLAGRNNPPREAAPSLQDRAARGGRASGGPSARLLVGSLWTNAFTSIHRYPQLGQTHSSLGGSCSTNAPREHLLQFEREESHLVRPTPGHRSMGSSLMRRPVREALGAYPVRWRLEDSSAFARKPPEDMAEWAPERPRTRPSSSQRGINPGEGPR